MAANNLPAWEVARKKRSFKQFIALKCVKETTIVLNPDNAVTFNVKTLDVEKMKALILDCVAALAIVQQEFDGQEQPDGEKEKNTASNKVFKASLISMASSLLHDGAELPKQSNSVGNLLRSFPVVDSKHSWLPLHWAVIANEQIVSEEDVKMIYASDPMALQRHHLRSTSHIVGFTPAHLLCMQEMTNRNLSLIRYFSVFSQHAFTMSASYSGRGDPLLYGYSALHAPCDLGQPTEELLKHLLQLDSSQLKMKKRDEISCTPLAYPCTPLAYLCANTNCNDRLITCLLEVDSSVELVWSGIAGCLIPCDDFPVSERVEMLLKANPEAAKHRNSNGMNLLHLTARHRKLSPQLYIDIMQRILAVHKEAVREVDSNGWLPVHIAARSSTVEVMEFLLSLYPESASMVTTDFSTNLLYLAACDSKKPASMMEAKVRLLCSRYPAMILQMTETGFTPFLVAVFSMRIPSVQVLYEIGGQEQMRLPVVHMDADHEYNGRLPLHFVISRHAEPLCVSVLSQEADCFRMLLGWYPEAAGIEGGVDMEFNDDEDDEEEEDEESRVVFKKTPYQLAVDEDHPPYYQRLLLRAVPNLNPAELHRLNYAERRMAMFLAFTAVTSQRKPLLMARLRFEKKDLVKHVISFL